MYRMTTARRAALRKAQLASARKRRGKRISRKAKAGIAVGVAGGAIVARHKISGSKITVRKVTNPTGFAGGIIPPHGWTFGRSFGKAEFNSTTHYKNRKGVLKGRDFRKLSASTPKRGPLGNYYNIQYQHNNLFGRKINNKLRTPVDRDAIPFYNPRAQKPWPHVNADVAREQNQRMRASSAARKRRGKKKK